jgi:hypothetical protein
MSEWQYVLQQEVPVASIIIPVDHQSTLVFGGIPVLDTLVRQDPRAARLRHIDVSMFGVMPDLDFTDESVTHLDAWHCMTLWMHAKKLSKEFGTLVPPGQNFVQMYFGGSIFLNKYNKEYMLFLRWARNAENGLLEEWQTWRWRWGITMLDYNWGGVPTYYAAVPANKIEV